jgi:hypothetical protein
LGAAAGAGVAVPSTLTADFYIEAVEEAIARYGVVP